MDEIAIDSFAAFHGVLHERFVYGSMFRGVSNSAHALVPRVGRQIEVYRELGLGEAELLNDERTAFDIFCDEGASLFPSFASSQIDRLVVAQHHGLPTRLLDWTFSPLVALFFATNADERLPGAVYVLYNSKTSIPWLKGEELSRPLTTEGVHGYQPKHVSRRVTAQSGLFTIHGNPTLPFESESVLKLVIASECKRKVFKTLKWYGVTHNALFPGLDGLARFLANTAFKNFEMS